MAKKAVSRILKRKRQLKKQIKNTQQQQKSQQAAPQARLCYFPQQNGHSTLAIQQAQNEAQMKTDHRNFEKVSIQVFAKTHLQSKCGATGLRIIRHRKRKNATFDDYEELKNQITKILNDLGPHYIKKLFETWEEELKEVIHLKGEYIH